jgi:hypothetical protein
LHIYIPIDISPPALISASLSSAGILGSGTPPKEAHQQTKARLTMTEHDDDLVASKTEGFKVGEKKTIEEYTKLGMLRLYALLFPS